MIRNELGRLVAEFEARRAQIDRLWQEADAARPRAREHMTGDARMPDLALGLAMHLLRNEVGLVLRRTFPARIRALDIDALARLEVEGQSIDDWCEWRIP